MRWNPTGLGLSLVALFAVTAGASVLTVDCSGGADYSTVQDAVDAAADADTILIAPCLYTEEVVVTGKALTLVGAGSDVTELRSLGSAAALRIVLSESGGGPFQVEGMSIVREPASSMALEWREGRLRLTGCNVIGKTQSFGGLDAGNAATVVGSKLTSLAVGSAARTSFVNRSRIGSALFMGGVYAPQHTLVSSESTFGNLTLSVGEASSVSDSIGTLGLSGDSDRWDSFIGEGSEIARLEGAECARIRLADCTIGDLLYVSWWMSNPSLDMTGCLITGDAVVDIPEWVPNRIVAGHSSRDWEETGILIEHCTVLGALDLDVEAYIPQWLDRRIRSNIVMGAARISATLCVGVITHNDFVEGATISTNGDSVYANITADPLFCDEIAGDYRLQDCSPCVGAAHDGTAIGRHSETCDCAVVVENKSWGAIKSVFR